MNQPIVLSNGQHEIKIVEFFMNYHPNELHAQTTRPDSSRLARSQPDAADREPVFWPAGGGQAFPADNCVQPDVPDCADCKLAP